MIKPILFSTPMVRAILDGRKTMTRRVIKDKDIINAWDCESDGTPIAYIEQETGDSYAPTYPARYQPGDILWVRETWRIDDWDGFYHYFASETPIHGVDRWRPSIHMPKSAARIWLRVTDVRVERVQEITNNDAIKEGCMGAECDCLHLGRSWMGCESCMNTGWQEPPIVEFAQLWDDINAKRGYGWSENPWVWVIGFERCDKPEEVTT